MAHVSFTMTLANLEATAALGRALGRALLPGEHLALEGGLGAGKTTLTRSLAEGFGVQDLAEVASPTYAYAHVYSGRGRKLYHLDFYRLGDSEAAAAFGLEEMLQDPQGSAVVEWADLFVELLHPAALWLTLRRQPGEQIRAAVLRVPEQRAAELVECLPSWAVAARAATS